MPHWWSVLSVISNTHMALLRCRQSGSLLVDCVNDVLSVRPFPHHVLNDDPIVTGSIGVAHILPNRPPPVCWSNNSKQLRIFREWRRKDRSPLIRSTMSYCLFFANEVERERKSMRECYVFTQIKCSARMEFRH